MDSAIELRHLRALVAIAEEGTFTDAAARLLISQPAVSRTIAALERALGVSLVERTTRSVVLTDAGRRAYRAAVDALAAVDEVAPAARQQLRPLRLGYAWSALGAHTTAVLRGWRAQHQQIPLEVHRVDERDAGLARGVTDVAIIRGEPGLSDCVARLVTREARVVALAAGHPLAGATSLALAELHAETVLTTAYGTTTLQLWPEEIRPRAALHLDNTDEWLTEIAGESGIGVTAESTAVQHPYPGVVYVPLTGVPPVDVHLVWPRRRPHPAVEAFCALVVDTVRAAPPSLTGPSAGGAG